MIKEEENVRNNYVSQFHVIYVLYQKTKILLDKTFKKLKKAKTGKDTIKGVHNYDILANPSYVQDFQYVPCHIPNRDLMI